MLAAKQSTQEFGPTSHRARRMRLTGVAVATGVFLALMTMTTAFGVVSCRRDPIITLSNGTQVQLVTSINASASQVTSVAYKLNIPSGLTVANVVYDTGTPAETFTWTANEPAIGRSGIEQFCAQAQVTATSRSSLFTLTVTATRGSSQTTKQVSGSSGQWISQAFGI